MKKILSFLTTLVLASVSSSLISSCLMFHENYSLDDVKLPANWKHLAATKLLELVRSPNTNKNIYTLLDTNIYTSLDLYHLDLNVGKIDTEYIFSGNQNIIPVNYYELVSREVLSRNHQLTKEGKIQVRSIAKSICNLLDSLKVPKITENNKTQQKYFMEMYDLSNYKIEVNLKNEATLTAIEFADSTSEIPIPSTTIKSNHKVDFSIKNMSNSEQFNLDELDLPISSKMDIIKEIKNETLVIKSDFMYIDLKSTRAEMQVKKEEFDLLRYAKSAIELAFRYRMGWKIQDLSLEQIDKTNVIKTIVKTRNYNSKKWFKIQAIIKIF